MIPADPLARYRLASAVNGVVWGGCVQVFFEGISLANFAIFFAIGTGMALVLRRWILGWTGWRFWIVLPLVVLVIGGALVGFTGSIYSDGFDLSNQLAMAAAAAVFGPLIFGWIFVPVALAMLLLLRRAGRDVEVS